MPFGEFQIHASNYSKHVFPKGRAPVGGIPDSFISNHLRVLADANICNNSGGNRAMFRIFSKY